MQAVYRVSLENLTQSGYYFVLYQNQREPSKSIAWMTVGIPPMQTGPSAGTLIWRMEYGVQVVEEPGYTDAYHLGSVSYGAQLGQVYQVDLVDGFTQFELLQTMGTAGYIEIINNTDLQLNLGVTLGGNLLATQLTYGGVRASFDMTSSSTYQIGVTPRRPVPMGEFSDSQSVITPVSIKFPDRTDVASVNLEVSGGMETFSTPVYSYESIDLSEGTPIQP